jgi:hypothetical protein
MVKSSVEVFTATHTKDLMKSAVGWWMEEDGADFAFFAIRHPIPIILFIWRA